MLKKFITVLTLCFSLSLLAAQTIPDEQRLIIIEEVMTELGFYDAAEIEARVRLWLLNQPIPRASGETLDQGACQTTACEPSASTGTLPMPRKVKVKGKMVNGNYTQNLKVKWKRPKALSEGSDYTFSYYEIYLSKNASSYEYFKIDPKYKNNGKLNNHQSIKFKGLEQANYQVQLRAVYDQLSIKSINNKAFLTGSGWTDPNAIPVLKPGSTVAHLDTTSPLYTCVKANGFADTTILTNITILNCAAKGLTDADMGYLTNFTGLVQLNIKKNYAITKIGLLSDLPLLNWLHLAKITTITDINSLKDFDSLETIFIKEMGLTNIPELPASITYINASFNNITSNAGGFFPDHTVTTLVLNSYADHRNGAGLTNTFFNSLAGKSINILTATNSQLSDITIISNINNITDTNLSGSNISGSIDITQFEGQCSISLNNTDIEEVFGVTTVAAVSLKDNSLLRLVRTFTENGQAPNYETIFPWFTYMQGSNGLYCDHYRQLVDAWDTSPTNFNKQQSNTIKVIEECLYPAIIQQVFLPSHCKPTNITNFSVIRQNNAPIYDLNWSKQDHDIWQVSGYDVRINGTDINSYASTVTLPLTIDLTSAFGGSGFDNFEVRACTSDPTNSAITSCGDWQSTITQCQTICTDNTLTPPVFSSTSANNTTGDYSISWQGSSFDNYQLQQSSGSTWVTVQNNASLSKSFSNQSNNTNYSYRLRGCNAGNICSTFSSIITISVQLQIPTLGSIASPNTSGNYTVSWSPVGYDTDVERYQLQEITNGTNWTTVSNVHNFSRSFTGKSNGVTYSYRLRACRVANNCSNFSPVKAVTVLFIPPHSNHNYTCIGHNKYNREL